MESPASAQKLVVRAPLLAWPEREVPLAEVLLEIQPVPCSAPAECEEVFS